MPKTRLNPTRSLANPPHLKNHSIQLKPIQLKPTQTTYLPFQCQNQINYPIPKNTIPLKNQSTQTNSKHLPAIPMSKPNQLPNPKKHNPPQKPINTNQIKPVTFHSKVKTKSLTYIYNSTTTTTNQCNSDKPIIIINPSNRPNHKTDTNLTSRNLTSTFNPKPPKAI